MIVYQLRPEGCQVRREHHYTAHRSQFYKDFAVMFYGANRPGAKVSQGMLDQLPQRAIY